MATALRQTLPTRGASQTVWLLHTLKTPAATGYSLRDDVSDDAAFLLPLPLLTPGRIAITLRACWLGALVQAGRLPADAARADPVMPPGAATRLTVGTARYDDIRRSLNASANANAYVYYSYLSVYTPPRSLPASDLRHSDTYRATCGNTIGWCVTICAFVPPAFGEEPQQGLGAFLDARMTVLLYAFARHSRPGVSGRVPTPHHCGVARRGCLATPTTHLRSGQWGLNTWFFTLTADDGWPYFPCTRTTPHATACLPHANHCRCCPTTLPVSSSRSSYCTCLYTGNIPFAV